MENCYTKILEQKGILGTVVIGKNGNPIKSTMNDKTSLHYAGLFGQVIDKANFAIESLDPENELDFLRIRTRKHEVIITPDDYLVFVVLQSLSDPIAPPKKTKLIV